jgi:hypothetical protein
MDQKLRLPQALAACEQHITADKQAEYEERQQNAAHAIRRNVNAQTGTDVAIGLRSPHRVAVVE